MRPELPPDRSWVTTEFIREDPHRYQEKAMNNQHFIEVFPQKLSTWDPRRLLPPSLRPHLYREIAGNGQTKTVSEVYSKRSNAVRAAQDEELWIHVVDGLRFLVRAIPPKQL